MKVEIKMEFSSLEEVQQFLSNKNIEVKSLGLPKVDPMRNHKGWTQSEINYVVDNYLNFKGREIAKSLCRSTGSVGQMILKLHRKGLLKRKINKAGKIKELN